MDLTVQTPSAVTWLENQLKLNGSAIVSSNGPATKVNTTIRATGEMTVELWLTPDAVSPKTAGRALVIGKGNNTFNVVLGQGYYNGSTFLWKGKLRTTLNSPNPIQGTVAAGLTHLVYTRSATDGHASLYVNGQLAQSKASNGNLSNWDLSSVLTLGNELTGGAGFEGTLSMAAVYSRSFDQARVNNNYLAGPGTQQPPTVNAGPDLFIESGTIATMAGIATDDGLPDPPALLDVTWVKQSGPGTATFADDADPTTTVTFSSPGVYTLRLEAFDGLLTSNDTIMVTVKDNTAPTVNAGPDVSVEYPNSGMLNGSVDDDGLPAPSAISTLWTQVSGPAGAEIASESTLATSVAFPVEGTYTFRLTARDGSPLIGMDDVVLRATSNQAPVVNAGPDQTVDIVSGATLAGTAPDDGLPGIPGAVTVAWTLVSGPGNVTFANPSNLATTVSFTDAGTYELRLSANDGALAADDTVTIMVGLPPRADADVIVRYGFDEATGSVVTDTSGVGTPLDLTIAAPARTTWVPGGLRIDNATSLLSSGAATKVTNAAKSSGAITIETWMSVGNVRPAQPGRILAIGARPSKENIALSQGYFLNQPTDLLRGRVTSSSGGTHPLTPIRDTDLHHVVYVVDTATHFSRMYVDGVLKSETPTKGTLSNWTNTYKLAIGSAGDGALPWLGTLRMMAIHDSALTPAQVAQNFAAGSGDQLPPTVDAGPNQQALLVSPGPVVVQLDGTVTDDGLPDPPAAISTAWTQVSGPAPAVFGTAASVDTSVSLNAAGVYVFELTADDSALTTADRVTVTVLQNAAPSVALASTGATLYPQPANLDGTVTDDGLPAPSVSARWTQQSGPGNATFVDDTAPTTMVSFDAPGAYVLRLTADDGELTSFAEITVTAGSNQAPNVAAGVDFSATTNRLANLDGTVTDDGLTPGPVVTLWSVISGPGNVVFGDPTAVDTGVAFDAAGEYRLRLGADDGDLQASDEVVVTVQDPAPAEAGVVAQYKFDEGSGTQVRDTSGFGTPLDLNVLGPSNVTWGPGTLTVDSPTTILSPTAATKIIDAAKLSGQVTIEAWVEVGQASPSEPGRVVTLSGSSANLDRNISLGQGFFAGQATDIWRARVGTSGSALHPYASIASGLQHVVLVLDTTRGVSEMYVNGVLNTSRTVSGDLSTWSDAYPLSLGSEPQGQRGWTGTYYEVTLFDRALGATEVTTRSLLPPLGQLPPQVDAGPDQTVAFSEPSIDVVLSGSVYDDGEPNPPGAVTSAWTQVAGPPGAVLTDGSQPTTTVTVSQPGTYEFALSADDGALQATDTVRVVVTSSTRVTAGLVSLYQFSETSGTVIADSSGIGTPANLTLDTEANVVRAADALTINAPVTMSGDGTKFRTAVQATNAFTVEAWVTPSAAQPPTPGWLVALASNSTSRNMVLSQGFWSTNPANNFESRIWTMNNYNNPLGTPANSVQTQLTHVVLTRAADGPIRMFINGVEAGSQSSSGSLASWLPDYQLMLGNAQDGSRPWLGTFDLVALYDKALSDTEIQTNFTLGPAG